MGTRRGKRRHLQRPENAQQALSTFALLTVKKFKKRKLKTSDRKNTTAYHLKRLLMRPLQSEYNRWVKHNSLRIDSPRPLPCWLSVKSAGRVNPIYCTLPPNFSIVRLTIAWTSSSWRIVRIIQSAITERGLFTLVNSPVITRGVPYSETVAPAEDELLYCIGDGSTISQLLLHCWATESKFSRFRPVRLSLAPRRAKRKLVAAPIPELAPVIKQTLPANWAIVQQRDTSSYNHPPGHRARMHRPRYSPFLLKAQYSATSTTARNCDLFSERKMSQPL